MMTCVPAILHPEQLGGSHDSADRQAELSPYSALLQLGAWRVSLASRHLPSIYSRFHHGYGGGALSRATHQSLAARQGPASTSESNVCAAPKSGNRLSSLMRVVF